MKKVNLFSKPSLNFLFIITLSCLIYSNSFEVPFVFDDKFAIVKNPIVKDLNYMFNPSEAKKYHGHFEYKSFKQRYVAYFTFALNYWLHGLDVTGYHLVNLKIHILNTLILYWLVILTFKTPILASSSSKNSSHEIALFASLLFSCHPIQTQAVTYIWQRVTLLSTTFFILSLCLFIASRINSKKSNKIVLISLLLYLGSIFSAVLAMKTKEIAFTLPLVIFLYEIMFFEGKFLKRLFYNFPILLTMLIIPLSLIEIDKIGTDLIMNIRESTRVDTDILRWNYLLTQLVVIVTYLRLIFLPINQNLDYDFQIYNTFFNTHVFVSFLILVSLFLLGIYFFFRSQISNKNFRIISFGIFWFFITLSVESSLIPIVDVIFEHRIYLPSVGFFIAICTGFFVLLNNFEGDSYNTIFIFILMIFLFTFSTLTYLRNNIWKNEIILWRDTIQKSPNKDRPHINLGLIFKDIGRPEEAMRHYKKALQINPKSDKAHINLGVALNDSGQTELAINHYRKALQINPKSDIVYFNLGHALYELGDTNEAIKNYLKAIDQNPFFDEALNNLGQAYNYIGNTEIAIKYFLEAIKINPNSAEAHNNLGKTLNNKGYTDKSIEHFLIAIRNKSDFEAAHINIGHALKIKGLIEEAKKHYLKALKINPNSYLAHYNMGVLFNKQGQPSEAIRHYLMALKTNPNLEKVHNNLGISLVLTGNKEKAITHFQKALEINPQNIQAKNNLKKALMKKK